MWIGSREDGSGTPQLRGHVWCEVYTPSNYGRLVVIDCIGSEYPMPQSK
jgi:hypothetical protein